MTRSFYLAESCRNKRKPLNNPKEISRRGKERIGEEINPSKTIYLLPSGVWSERLLRGLLGLQNGTAFREKSIVYVYLTNGNLPIA